MSLVRGPFDLRWGKNTLKDIQDISLDYSVDSNDYSTVDFRKYTIEGAITASVTITLLATDTASLAVVLPQFFVPSGQKLSSGERVNDPDGAIDVVAASCSTLTVYNDLDVVSCGLDGETFRLKHARTSIDSMDFADNTVRTVSIVFRGEPAQGVAAIQFFQNGTITSAS